MKRVFVYDDGERLFSKLFLNNIYGKFGTNPKRVSSRYELVDGIVHRSENVETTCDSVILPADSVIFEVESCSLKK